MAAVLKVVVVVETRTVVAIARTREGKTRRLLRLRSQKKKSVD
jgi:hypothetical protein